MENWDVYGDERYFTIARTHQDFEVNLFASSCLDVVKRPHHLPVWATYSPQHRSQSHRDKHLSSNEDPCNDHSPAYYCTVEGFNMPRAFWSKLVLIEGYLIALDNLSYYLLEIFRHYPFWDMRFI